MNSLSSPLSDFMPHGMCYLWEPELLWLHVLSDLVIALAYFSIPLALVYFSRLGGRLPYKWIVLLFSAFILACGLTHVMGIWTIWHPDYYWSGFLKVGTALLSLITAIALWPLVQKAVALPNLFSLQEANEDLVHQVNQRKAIEADLQSRTQQLEDSLNDLTRLNDLMTGREVKMIKLKEEVNALSRELGRPLPYNKLASSVQS
ncbi:MAG: hypothetical protein WD032_11910 [Nitrospirales bacterium]